MTRPDARDQLLDATAELIARHGYRGTGVNAVLAASGVPNGSLYHHFPDGKDQLIAASIARTSARTRDDLVATMQRGPEAGVRLIFDYLAKRLRTDEFDAGCRIAAPLADAGGEIDVVREAAADGFSSWTDAIADGLVEHGWARKAARSTAVAIICLFEGGILVGQAQRSTRALSAARDAALALVAAGQPDGEPNS